MKKEPNLSFVRGDWIAVVLVLLLAAAVLVLCLPRQGEENAVVQVLKEGELIYELPLHSDRELQIGGKYQNTVIIQNGKVYVTESTCPGGDCVHTKGISRSGQSIVCLPNRLELRITGTGEVDFAVG
jgi:hypothetical protein